MELTQNIHLLGDLLGKVISELESPQLFEIEERIRALAKARRVGDDAAAQELHEEVIALRNEEARVIASAFATYFDLVNLAEENQRVQYLRQRADASYPEPISESIGEAISILKKRGMTREQMSALLNGLSIAIFTPSPSFANATILYFLAILSGIMEKILSGIEILLSETNGYLR